MFTIYHFNSCITYSSEGFLDHNLDFLGLNPNFIFLPVALLSVLRMAMGKVSSLASYYNPSTPQE